MPVFGGNKFGDSSFNSLSRDHSSLFSSLPKCKDRILSTPSLGITWDMVVEMIPEKYTTFNSLSRDHKNLLPRDKRIQFVTLSTPSLGITSLYSSPAQLLLKDLSTPSLWITTKASLSFLFPLSTYFQLPLSGSLGLTGDGRHTPDQLLSTPSLGITVITMLFIAYQFSELSTPSLGITRYAPQSRVAAEAAGEDFQLPLSGSRGVAACRLGERGSFQLPLSGSLPSE